MSVEEMISSLIMMDFQEIIQETCISSVTQSCNEKGNHVEFIVPKPTYPQADANRRGSCDGGFGVGGWWAKAERKGKWE